MSIEYYYCIHCKKFIVGYKYPIFKNYQEVGYCCFQCWQKKKNEYFHETVNYYLNKTIECTIDKFIDEMETIK